MSHDFLDGDGAGGEPACLERVRSNVNGGAFPRPPVLPVVAVLTLCLGMSLGIALVPKSTSPQPSPDPSMRPSPDATSGLIALPSGEREREVALVTPGPASTELPHSGPPLTPSLPQIAPEGGLSLQEAIAIAVSTYKIDPADVFSASIVLEPYVQLQPATDSSSNGSKAFTDQVGFRINSYSNGSVAILDADANSAVAYRFVWRLVLKSGCDVTTPANGSTELGWSCADGNLAVEVDYFSGRPIGGIAANPAHKPSVR